MLQVPHQADVLRLELLLQFGGVYLDLDILLLRPLAELFAYPEGVLMAHEGAGGTIGAGNALIVARRNATMLQEWYAEYRSFSAQIWNGFSVRLPMKLANAEAERTRTSAAHAATPGSGVRLLGYTAFYWPPWSPWGVAQLYRTPRCVVPGSHAVHLWETKVWTTLLGSLTPDAVRRRSSCFEKL